MDTYPRGLNFMIFHKLGICIVIITAICCFEIAVAGDVVTFAKEQINIKKAIHYKGGIKLELGKAVELKTRHKIISVSVGREDIADLIPVAPKLIRVLGLKPGSTNLIIRYDDNSAEEFEILVNKGFTVEVISGTVTNPDASLTGW